MNQMRPIKCPKLFISNYLESPYLSNEANSKNKHFYCYVYKITNLKEGLFYFGAHKTIKLNDGYASSSVNVRKDINRLGPENFKKEVVKFFNTSEEMFRYEEKMIRKVLGHPNCYNRGVTPECKIKNCVLVKDSEENFYYVKVDDPRIGKTLFYSGIGKVSVMDKDGNTFQTSIDDPRYLSGELVAPNKGQVTVKTKDGWINISQEEYRKNKDKYITPSNNRIIVKHKGQDNEKGFAIPLEEYKKNPDLYESANKGWILVRDKKDGTIKSVKKEDMTDDMEPFSKGMVIVKDKDGHKFYVDVDDPRYVSGELRFFREGKKWMHKGNKKIQVDPDKVDKKLKEGWKLGSIENGYYWVTKDGINKKIEKPLLEEYLKAGWRKGATQIKKRWVTKDNISKSVLESEYENYLKDGWKPGMKTNLRWMVSPDGIRKMIKPEDIDSYLDKGWILTPQGKKKNKN